MVLKNWPSDRTESSCAFLAGVVAQWLLHLIAAILALFPKWSRSQDIDVTSLVVSMVELSSIHDELIGIHTCLMDAQKRGVTIASQV
jgi:hypothetical protein